MTTTQDIIAFKTSAWQHAGMTRNYAQRMHSELGTNRLKNEIETSLCRENVRGTEILDVGVGTGRGSLPLAAAGYRVTGVDASEAMLEQCRREAGATPIQLQRADLTQLPFADASFDSLISLNVAVHFPNWREALAEWSRVVRPDGCVVFDIHSRDHLNAVGAARGMQPDALLTTSQRERAEEYMERVTIDELVAAAHACGLSLCAAVPYGLVLGGGNVNYWFVHGLLSGALGDRTLSWVARDERLYAFAQFLECEIAARLTTAATTRFMAVFEKRRDDAGSQRALRKAELRTAAFLGGDARGFFGEDCVSSLAALREHLAYAPNAALAAMLLSDPVFASARTAVAALLGDALALSLLDAQDRLATERSAERTLAEITSGLRDDGALAQNGVDYSAALEYEGFHHVLDARYFTQRGRA